MWHFMTFCREVADTARARRRTVAVLDALSDRMLDDMGLDRSEIDACVRSGMPWPASPLAPRTLYRPSLRGCG